MVKRFHTNAVTIPGPLEVSVAHVPKRSPYHSSQGRQCRHRSIVAEESEKKAD